MNGTRVLMTADAVGGVWRYAIDLGTELTRRGAQVMLAVMGPSPSAWQRAEAHAAGLNVVAGPYRLEWMDDPWDDVERAGGWLLELERQFAPTLIHLNGYAHAALPWRSPVLVVAHSCVRTWWRAVRGTAPPPHLDHYTAVVAAGLAAAQVVVSPTAALGAALQAEYGGRLTLRVIPNGHRPADVTGPDQTRRELVLAAGRLWDDAKNIAALCAAAPAVPWPVYVAGETGGGEYRPWRAVRLLGQISSTTLAEWYRCASIYALPARYEPFGLSVLEAASAGCALVLGDIPSLRENWDGAAVFVDPADAAALGQALRQLAAQPEARTALAERARARAATLTIERTADGYCELYEALSV